MLINIVSQQFLLKFVQNKKFQTLKVVLALDELQDEVQTKESIDSYFGILQINEIVYVFRKGKMFSTGILITVAHEFLHSL